eukprot:TRINITY_DN4743_c0_g1_i3.p1 TRINITY_DN4743_c0_g1~~TRINITY_DN4743_c0_g1_i3.p1  ORF type:complete len:1017 (+),score=218.76 TRINITY_DN4743_c0_g1_i3:119-3169(+)
MMTRNRKKHQDPSEEIPEGVEELSNKSNGMALRNRKTRKNWYLEYAQDEPQNKSDDEFGSTGSSGGNSGSNGNTTVNSGSSAARASTRNKRKGRKESSGHSQNNGSNKRAKLEDGKKGTKLGRRKNSNLNEMEETVSVKVESMPDVPQEVGILQNRNDFANGDDELEADDEAAVTSLLGLADACLFHAQASVSKREDNNYLSMVNIKMENPTNKSESWSSSPANALVSLNPGATTSTFTNEQVENKLFGLSTKSGNAMNTSNHSINPKPTVSSSSDSASFKALGELANAGSILSSQMARFERIYSRDEVSGQPRIDILLSYNSNKIAFRSGSAHVAIAYHIYFQQQQKSVATRLNSIPSPFPTSVNNNSNFINMIPNQPTTAVNSMSSNSMASVNIRPNMDRAPTPNSYSSESVRSSNASINSLTDSQFKFHDIQFPSGLSFTTEKDVKDDPALKEEPNGLAKDDKAQKITQMNINPVNRTVSPSPHSSSLASSQALKSNLNTLPPILSRSNPATSSISNLISNFPTNVSPLSNINPSQQPAIPSRTPSPSNNKKAPSQSLSSSSSSLSLSNITSFSQSTPGLLDTPLSKYAISDPTLQSSSGSKQSPPQQTSQSNRIQSFGYHNLNHIMSADSSNSFPGSTGKSTQQRWQNLLDSRPSSNPTTINSTTPVISSYPTNSTFSTNLNANTFNNFDRNIPSNGKSLSMNQNFQHQGPYKYNINGSSSYTTTTSSLQNGSSKPPSNKNGLSSIMSSNVNTIINPNLPSNVPGIMSDINNSTALIVKNLTLPSIPQSTTQPTTTTSNSSLTGLLNNLSGESTPQTSTSSETDKLKSSSSIVQREKAEDGDTSTPPTSSDSASSIPLKNSNSKISSNNIKNMLNSANSVPTSPPTSSSVPSPSQQPFNLAPLMNNDGDNLKSSKGASGKSADISSMVEGSSAASPSFMLNINININNTENNQVNAQPNINTSPPASKPLKVEAVLDCKIDNTDKQVLSKTSSRLSLEHMSPPWDIPGMIYI